MDLKIIYEDNDVLVVDKPAEIAVFPEGESLKSKEKTLIDALIKKYPELAGVGDPPRYGIVHRLDKDTSGVLLVAKSNESLIFLQKQFINRKVEKKYVCLVEGIINPVRKTEQSSKSDLFKNNSAEKISNQSSSEIYKKEISEDGLSNEVKDDWIEIKTLIGRSPGDKRKQKAYPLNETGPGKREAITEYKVLNRYKDYTLLEVEIKTGRRHQIRCHFSFLQHPIAGDKLYGFKNSKTPEGLTRQFLHAKQLKIQLPNGKTEEFVSDLPEELNNVLKILNNKF